MSHLGGHINKNNIEYGSILFLKKKFGINNMLDIGCGPGDMEEVCNKLDIAYFGLEGDEECKKNNIKIIDFSKEKYDSEDIFDLGYSTEFLEHVEEKYIENYINAFKNCKYLLITAAPPKWPGHHHVNCKNHKYWLKLFNKYGFILDPYVTLNIREKSTMNINRTNKKKFIKHRALFFINTIFNKNINFINDKPSDIIENKYYKYNNYIEKEIKKNNAIGVTSIENHLFKSTIPLVSYLEKNEYIDWLDNELNKLSNKCLIFNKNRSKNYTLQKILNDNNFKNCLEFGVFTGTTINIISKKCNNVYGFDSFEGLPEDWNGVCNKERFEVSKLPTVDNNVKLIQGWFNKTLEDFLSINEDIDIDLIHIDCDLYSSTKQVFDILLKYNKLKKGIIIVFDELINYNKFYEGEIKALYEIVKNNNINFEWIHTHGNVVDYDTIITKQFQNMSFKEYRNLGYQQEVAIKII
jgi:hypothetical protein